MAVIARGVGGPVNHRVALAGWIRSVSACQAAILLAERGLVIESAAILRTGFEQLFYAQALLKDPRVLERLRDQDARERQNAARLDLEDADVNAIIGTSQRQALKDLIAQKSGSKSINVYEAAKIAGLAGVFQTTYRQLSSVATHSTYTSIGATFGESIFDLRLVQDTDDLPIVLGLVRDCLRLGSTAFIQLDVSQENASVGDPTA